MKYLYIVNGEQQGPLAKEELIAAGVKADTLVWCEGMTEWIPAGKVEDLSSLYYGTVPPPMPSQEQVAPAKPNNYLAWAIISTIMCCMPLGVVSIIYSTYVDSRYANKDYDGAIKASRRAKNWAIASVITFAVIAILYIAMLVVYAQLYGSDALLEALD